MATKHTGLPQKCSKMFPVPPDSTNPKLFQVASWLWAVWQVLGLGCRVHFIFCWKGLVYCLKKTPSSLELAEKSFRLNYVSFWKDLHLEATTNPETRGISQPGSRRQENWPSVEHWVTFCWKSRPGIAAETIRIPWELVFFIYPLLNQSFTRGHSIGTQFGGDSNNWNSMVYLRVCPSLHCLGGW